MNITSPRKAILYLTAVFVVGLLIGGLGGFTIGVVSKFKLPSGPEWEVNIFTDLKKKLTLRADQEAEVKAAVHLLTQDIVGAFKDLGNASSNAVINCQRRIEPLLDPAQRAALSNIVAGQMSKDTHRSE